MLASLEHRLGTVSVRIDSLATTLGDGNCVYRATAPGLVFAAAQRQESIRTHFVQHLEQLYTDMQQVMHDRIQLL